MIKLKIHGKTASAVLMLLICAAALWAGIPFPENSAAAGYDTESIKGNSIKAGTLSITVTEEASFMDGQYYMTGSVVFPYFMADEYRGRKETLEQFFMDGDGKLHVNHPLENASFTLPAMEEGYSFSLNKSRLVIEGDSVYMEFPDALLNLPAQYGEESLKLEGVVYRLSGSRLDFDYSSMTYESSAQLVISGLPVTVTDVSFVPQVLKNGWTNYQLSLGGSVTLAEDGPMPEFLKSGKIPFGAVLNGEGKLCSFDARIDNVSGSIATEEFPLTAASLKNASMALSFRDGSVYLIAEEGVLVLDGSVPAWLYGRELDIKSFMFDFKKGEYEALVAESSPFDLDMEPTIKNARVTISYEADGTSAITVAGTMDKKLQVSSVFTEAQAGTARGVVTLRLDGTPVSMKLIQEY